MSGAGIAASALTPSVMALVGRDLIRRGESVHAIEIGARAPVLRLPAVGTCARAIANRNGGIA